MEKLVKLTRNLFLFLLIIFGLFTLVSSNVISNGIIANGECSFSQIPVSNFILRMGLY